MIILGDADAERPDERRAVPLPEVRGRARLQAHAAEDLFTMYFLPLFPVSKGAEWWECQTCTRAYEPRAEALPPAAQQKHSF